jgi:hypothetical protein
LPEDPEVIDAGIEAALVPGAWIENARFLPKSIADIRGNTMTTRTRLGASISVPTPEQMHTALLRLQDKARQLDMSLDEYCSTAYHRTNGLDPKKGDYVQSESLARTLAED